MSISISINSSAILKAFFEISPATLQCPEISPFFEPDSSLEEQNQELQAIQQRLEDIIFSVFTRIRKALSKNASEAFIRSFSVFGKELSSWQDSSAQQISRLFNKILGKHFGISLQEDPFNPEQSQFFYITWEKEHETSLRNLLDIPRIEDQGDIYKINADRKKAILTDITFVVEGQPFPAHKALITSATALEALIQREPDQQKIVVKGISALAFDAILEYIYTGRVFFAEKSVTDIRELALAAHKLKIPKLEELCSLRLLITLSQGTVEQVAQFATSIGNHGLLGACRKPQSPHPAIDAKILIDIFSTKDLDGDAMFNAPQKIDTSRDAEHLSLSPREYIITFCTTLIHEVQKSLFAGREGASFRFYDFNLSSFGNSILLSLYKDFFCNTLDLSITEAKSRSSPSEKNIYIQWPSKHDKDLRNLLGVPYQSNPESQEQCLNRQRKMSENTDVVFQVEQELFPAHMFFIAKNPFLCSLIGGGMHTPIIVEGITAELFEVLLEYLYTGEVSLTSLRVDQIIDLALFAERCNISSLRNLCVFRLLVFVSSKSSPLILREACAAIKDPYLLRACQLCKDRARDELTSSMSRLSLEEDSLVPLEEINPHDGAGS